MIIPLYKPKGPTSHDMIDAVRRITGIKKVGHAGTLDPLASGVLVVGITREGTRQMHELVKKEKEYIATIKLGQTSTTDDEEGEKSGLLDVLNLPDEAQIRAILPNFLGRIQQVPPVYSAVKIQGKPAHRRVRKGEEITLEPREVEIKEIELLSYAWPLLVIRVATGSGVYIRSLARDLGQALGCGGYLADLERTRVGQWSKEEALTLEAFERKWEDELAKQITL